ncbi:NADP-dependent malic enzyme [Desmophyllum pertusum]|uniref:Malic enzyme n=1 Tax=Desmophyllum pertusum TaxID=174260 RepID=A0A9X0A6C4_9CNID|nr:NADP-dependent malic enzyme [Desmophyllum pertusum]
MGLGQGETKTTRQEAVILAGAGQLQKEAGLSVIQTSGITMSAERHVNKIPTIRGTDIMRDPRLNKGTAFTLKERQILGIHGLLPPCISNQEVQCERMYAELHRKANDLERYILLMALLERNEALFFKILMDHTEELMPIVYTPTVGLACQKYGMIFRRPRGLFVSIHDLGHVEELLANWPVENVKAIVVTDGERILGLGDLGCCGMGIPVGKLALYTVCSGIDPEVCLPVMIDVGTNNQALLDDPLYIGVPQKRENGQAYDDLIDEFIRAATQKYGESVLIQFEDFGNHNAFRLLEKYRNKICTFNDDIQGTASVTVAGLLAALQITKNKLADHKFLFQGAGEAAIGIADLLVLAMIKEGLSQEEARQRIWLVDSRGLVAKDRPVGGLNAEKLKYAHVTKHISSLAEVVKTVKPTAIIGVAAVAGAFTEEIVKSLASFNDRPIIFALSNPTSKAECTAEQAYTWTNGKAVFASGSPFAPVTLPDGRHFIPGQGNNAYIFPGVALGVIACKAQHVTDEMFLLAAESLANLVEPSQLEKGCLFPPLSDIRDVSFKVAVDVVKLAYTTGLATVHPEPEDIGQLVKENLYSPDYMSYIPHTYSWPTE